MARRRDLHPERRELLLRLAGAAVAMGGVGSALVGCESPRTDGLVIPPDAGSTGEVAQPQVDVDALRAEIWMEDRAIQAYELLKPGLSEGVQPVAQLFRDHHWAHRMDGVAKLEAMGVEPPGTPGPLEGAPELDAGDVPILEYALTVEKQAVRAYMGLISQMTLDTHRYSAADILGSEFSHVLALQAALGDGAPPTVAFISDLFED